MTVESVRDLMSNFFFLLFLEAWWGSVKCGEGEGAVGGAPSVFGKSGSWQALAREDISVSLWSLAMLLLS
jgi:hypothetical protein